MSYSHSGGNAPQFVRYHYLSRAAAVTSRGRMASGSAVFFQSPPPGIGLHRIRDPTIRQIYGTCSMLEHLTSQTTMAWKDTSRCVVDDGTRREFVCRSPLPVTRYRVTRARIAIIISRQTRQETEARKTVLRTLKHANFIISPEPRNTHHLHRCTSRLHQLSDSSCLQHRGRPGKTKNAETRRAQRVYCTSTSTYGITHKHTHPYTNKSAARSCSVTPDVSVRQKYEEDTETVWRRCFP